MSVSVLEDPVAFILWVEETLAIYQTTQYRFLEDHNLATHCHGTTKSHIRFKIVGFFIQSEICSFLSTR